MSRSKKLNKSLSLLIALVMIMGSFSSLVYADSSKVSTAREATFEAAQDKIEPQLMNKLENEDLAEVMVYMKDQVDTENIASATRDAVSNTMTPYNTKMAVRTGVVESLIDKQETTQVNLINYLEQEK